MGGNFVYQTSIQKMAPHAVDESAGQCDGHTGSRQVLCPILFFVYTS